MAHKYFTIHEPRGDILRIGAAIDNAASSAAGEPLVHLWVSNGPSLGGYRLSRFEGAKITAKTVTAVLFPA